MSRLLPLLVFAVVVAASTASATSGVGFCGGSQLSGSFSVIRGSAGARNISHRLALKNVSRTECSVTGLPQGRLLGKAGKPLPTHVKAAFRGALTAVLVRPGPGRKDLCNRTLLTGCTRSWGAGGG